MNNQNSNGNGIQYKGLKFKLNYSLFLLDADGCGLVKKVGDNGKEEHILPINHLSILSGLQSYGLDVVWCTGRSYGSIRGKIKKSVDEYHDILPSLPDESKRIHMPSHGKIFSHYITFNGAEIYNQKGELIDNTPLDGELLKEVYEELKTNHEESIIFRYFKDTAQTIVNTGKNENLYESYVRKNPDVNFERVSEFSVGGEPGKAIIVSQDNISQKKILQYLNSKFSGKISFCPSSENQIEINAYNANKLNGAIYVINELNKEKGEGRITLDKVIAMDDGLNGLELLTQVKKAGGLSIAPPDSPSEVIEAASYVPPLNEKTALEQAINDYLINNLFTKQNGHAQPSFLRSVFKGLAPIKRIVSH